MERSEWRAGERYCDAERQLTGEVASRVYGPVGRTVESVVVAGRQVYDDLIQPVTVGVVHQRPAYRNILVIKRPCW